jgi:FkbM family methyltransferase
MKINWLQNPKALRILPSFLTTWGWWSFALDVFELKTTPYRFGRRMMRPKTTDRSIYLEIFAGRVYGPALPVLKSARCIVDVGANIGFFTQWARQTNPSARIHLFEPLSINSDRCLLDDNMVLHKAAVADYSGQLPVTVEADLNYGSSHLAVGHFTAPDPHPPITVVDARELFKLCGTEVIDVLKLDCEGAELGILKCMQLAAVRCVIFEYHRNEEIPLLRQVLEQNGFEVTVMDEYHRIMCAMNRAPKPRA